MTDRRYSKTEIERIVSEGSIKQKARLFLRDRMGYSGTGFILDYPTIDRLLLSVDSMYRRDWVRYVSFGLRLENGFKDISNILRNIDRYRDELRVSILTILEFEKYEVILNKLLTPNDYFLGEDYEDLKGLTEERLRLRRIERVGFTMTAPHLEDDGTINLNLTGKGSATERADESVRLLRENMRDFVCYESAMRRRIEESEINVPEYEDLMTMNRQRASEPVSLSVRWSGSQDSRLFRLGPQEDRRDPLDLPFPALKDIVERYSVSLDDILPDDNLIKKIYNQI